MIQDHTYTVTASSAFVAPEVYKNLSLQQARDLAWELKNDQFKVVIEQDEALYELGACGHND